MTKTAQKLGLRIDLNLLHPKEIPPPLPERFLRWLITYGRFIVIVVEVIVVGAFLMRFKLDADIDDLKTQITKDLPYIKGLQQDEAIIRQTQFRISTIKNHYKTSPKWADLFSKISSLVPENIHFQNIALDYPPAPAQQTLQFKINATTNSNSDLGMFLNNLRGAKDSTDKLIYKDVNLASISFDAGAISFTITGSL